MVMCANGMFGMRNPNERDARPGDWVHTAVATTPSIELKFHHVISWDCLRDAWQGLLEHGQWDALEAYMTAVGVTGASAARGRLHRGEDLDLATRDALFAKLSWPGWNIVQGPGERWDEGGSEVDLFQEGMSAIDTERHRTIGLLWIEMDLLLKKLNRPAMRQRREASNPDLRNAQPVTVAKLPNHGGVNDAAGRMARALYKMAKFKSASYIPYLHSMWDTVSAGAVKRGVAGVWEATPHFRKRALPMAPGDLPPRMTCTRCRQPYDRPRVPPGTKVYCPACDKQTVVDFANAAA